MKEAYNKYDWLFIMEAAMVTHLNVDAAVDHKSVLELQEVATNKLKALKHK
jgi:hypothetical protein